MQNTVATDYTLFAPKVRYTSTFDGEFDAMSTWCAQLELGYLDERDDDAPQVVGGYAEFAIINVGDTRSTICWIRWTRTISRRCSMAPTSPLRCRNSGKMRPSTES